MVTGMNTTNFSLEMSKKNKNKTELPSQLLNKPDNTSNIL